MAFVMLEKAEVEVMVDERASQDMDGSLSSNGGRRLLLQGGQWPLQLPAGSQN